MDPIHDEVTQTGHPLHLSPQVKLQYTFSKKDYPCFLLTVFYIYQE